MNDEHDVYLDEIEELEQQVACLQSELAALYEAIKAKNKLLDDYASHLDALRPWAEVGKRAVADEWYADEMRSQWHCCNTSVPMFMADKHAPDCPIPALLAQLEAADA